MGPIVKASSYRDWIQTSSAKRLLSLEAGWLREVVSDFHGVHLGYAGIDLTPRFLKRARVQHTFRMGLPWQADQPCDTRMNEESWPLPDRSLDVVVLQHGLDLSTRPHQMLREATRVLVPSGYIVVVGFNPYSLFGLIRHALFYSSRLPWVVNPVSARRLKDWLTILDFRIESVTPVSHIWPVLAGTAVASRRVDRILAGNSWLPSNAYILVARKTVAGVTPIGSKLWQWSPEGFGMPSPAVGSVAAHSLDSGRFGAGNDSAIRLKDSPVK